MAAVLFLACGTAGAQTSSAVRAPQRAAGSVREPQKTKDVRPVYPPMALASHVQGIVILEATVETDGRVEDAKVIRSIPLLDQAALDAVRQWEFTPVPVPVIMTMTVNFTLLYGTVPQNAPCADQPTSFTELADAFDKGDFPSASETAGSWVAIGITVPGCTGLNKYLNCAGLRRGNKFEEVMLAGGRSVEMHVIGTTDRTRTLEPDDAGSVTFPVDSGGDGRLPLPSYNAHWRASSTFIRKAYIEWKA